MHSIPDRIITTFSSAYCFPPTFVRCYSIFKNLHPRWDFRFFSDSAARKFIKEKRPDLVELYDFYPRAVQRADLFRVIAVHELGGFYLDLDVHLFQPLHQLRKFPLVLTEEWKIPRETFFLRGNQKLIDSRDRFQIGNYGFASERRHWFLGEVIEEMIKRADIVNDKSCSNEDVISSTGPDVFTAVYSRHRARLSAESIVLRGRRNPPDPKPGSQWGESWWFQFGSFGNHLMTSTWRK